MSRTKIIVLFGGVSNEYAVSLKSAASVVENLDPNRYEVLKVGITRDGKWLYYTGSTEDMRQDLWHFSPACVPALLAPWRGTKALFLIKDGCYTTLEADLVFPVLHGKNGEDGTVQGLLELSGMPYVGCGTLASALCMDKAVAHALVKGEGIEVPQSFVLRQGEAVETVKSSAKGLGYPLFVKPACSGSSIGITKAGSELELLAAIKLAFAHDAKVVVEKAVEGFEVGCAVMGGDEPVIGAVDEIELEGDFFNFEEKYTLAHSKIHTPARLSGNEAEKICETAKKIYRLLGLKGLARVDLFYTRDGQILFNEVNTLPGFTEKSRYPRMFSAVGLSYGQLLDKLITFTLDDRAAG